MNESLPIANKSFDKSAEFDDNELGERNASAEIRLAIPPMFQSRVFGAAHPAVGSQS